MCCLLSFFVARLCGFLVCILWSCFFFVVMCSFLFSFLKKRRKNGHNKKTKNKNAEKRKNQLAKLYSQIVSIFFGGGEVGRATKL